jgi:hypothetical protein
MILGSGADNVGICVSRLQNICAFAVVGHLQYTGAGMETERVDLA